MNNRINVKQWLYYGLACFACVIVLNTARNIGRNQSVQDAGLMPGDLTPSPALDESISYAQRIPSVDQTSLKFPVQPAGFDSIAWDSSVEPSYQVQPSQNSEQDGTRDSAARIASPPSFVSTKTAPLDTDQPVRVHTTTPVETASSAKYANAPEPKVILSQTQPGIQKVFANPFVESRPESQFIPELPAVLPADPPIPNPGVNQPTRISGIYPLTGTLNQPANAPETPTRQPWKVAHRFDAVKPKMRAATEPAETVTEQQDLTASFETELDIQSNQTESTVRSNREYDHDSFSNKTSNQEDPPGHNDFAPPVANAPTPIPASASTTEAPRTSEAKEDIPSVLQGAEKFVLAEQPQPGDQWKDNRPITDRRAWLVEPSKDDFSPDPIDSTQGYDPYEQMQVYEGKTLYATQRPLVELGRPWYQLGQLSPGYSWFGKHNNIVPQFLVYGDVRTAAASNSQNGDRSTQIAFEANLDFDLKLTGTERFHMFMSPFDDGQNTRWLLDEDRFVDKFDANIDFGYFEGDLGAIVGGFTDQTLPFDFPFAIGVIPLLLQNGVWMEDAFLGVAATIPARSSRRFNISNMDTTFFAGYDKINSDAFANDDSAARMYGMATFIDAMNGYFEIDYAFLDDRTTDNRSYHNIGFGYSRRFGRLLSHSTRVIVNAGQSTEVVENSADGVLLLSENSLITSSPSTLVPYMNFFAGFDRPQSAARAAVAEGVLRNTGILFESDGMTNYPTLDPTANDTYGGALGLNLIADDFSQQLVVELAALGVMGDDANRNAPGSQYGVGFRYQLPLTNAVILRADGMYGVLENDHDVHGVRLELRHKY